MYLNGTPMFFKTPAIVSEQDKILSGQSWVQSVSLTGSREEKARSSNLFGVRDRLLLSRPAAEDG